MRKLTTRRWLVPFICLLLIVAFVVTPATARKKHEMTGKMAMTYPEQERLEVGDTEEHVLTFGTAEGINECTSEHTFMDGAQAVNMAFGDLVQGSGSHQGYLKLVQGDDVVFCKWKGLVTTTVPEEGAPIIAFEGNFSYIKGAGQFENIQGSGTYKGQFTSKTEYSVEWEGKYSIEK
jgi:hypothetical protein